MGSSQRQSSRDGDRDVDGSSLSGREEQRKGGTQERTAAARANGRNRMPALLQISSTALAGANDRMRDEMRKGAADEEEKNVCFT